MADLDSKDFNIVRDLKLTDRITLTDSATGYQFASMEVSTFLEQLIKKMAVSSEQENGLMSSTDKRVLYSIKRTANHTGDGKYVLVIKLSTYHFNQASVLAVIGSPGGGSIGIDALLLKNSGVATAISLSNSTSYHQGYFCRQIDGTTELWVKIKNDIQVDVIPVGGNGYLFPLTLSDTEPSGLTPVEVQRK